MRWTNNKRHYVVAKHQDELDLTPGDILASLAIVVLVMVTLAGVAIL